MEGKTLSYASYCRLLLLIRELHVSPRHHNSSTEIIQAFTDTDRIIVSLDFRETSNYRVIDTNIIFTKGAGYQILNIV